MQDDLQNDLMQNDLVGNPMQNNSAQNVMAESKAQGTRESSSALQDVSDRTSNPVLRFCDDPMFKRVMEKEEICKGVLERILGKPIGEVIYSNTEQERRLGPTGKAIRLDAYLVEAEGHVYDIEMQIAHNPLLPLRFRGYQSVLDGSLLKHGASYSELRGSYVIFICMHDPFGAGLPVYSIERTCLEKKDLQFDCKSHWIALNASAWHKLGSDISNDKNDPKSNNSNDLGLLLKYIYTNKITKGDSLLADIDAEVAHNNTDKEWLMTMIDSISIAEEEALIRGRLEGRTEGIAMGKAEGEQRYISLIEKLIQLNRLEDIRLANTNPELRQKLYQEFGL